MSSFIRRIERQVVPSRKIHTKPDGYGGCVRDRKGNPLTHANPPREVFFGGRGSKLGVKNPNDKAFLARKRREERNAARH